MPVKYCKSGYIVSMRKTNVLFALKELMKLLFPVLMQFPLLEWGGGVLSLLQIILSFTCYLIFG